MDARDTGGFDRAGLVEVGGDAAGDAAEASYVHVDIPEKATYQTPTAVTERV